MIQLKISGRAGNQFFQYAFVNNYVLNNNLNEKIYVSFEHLKSHNSDNTTFKNELKNFKIDNMEEIEKINFNIKQKIWDFAYKVLYKIIRNNAKLKKRKLKQSDYNFIIKVLQKPLNVNGLYYYIPGMREFYKSKTKNIIFFGCYEDSNYYIKNRANILKCYTPKEDRKKENEELYNAIENNNSVCVTIRRGDFLTAKHVGNYYICNQQYFKSAIEKMNRLVDNPHYIVFSDDVEWCKNNIKFPKNTKFESGNDPIWEKIRLMYSCKNFIISNSTFSWWSQYLSRNDEKKVIAPKNWNNFEYSEHIYDKNWILI